MPRKRIADSRLRAVLRVARDCGLTIEMRDTCVVIKDANDQRILTAHYTTSDWRWHRNAASLLRRYTRNVPR